ncbi:DUF1499 domain-containing protein [Aliterella atlantica]|uniref:DUF1499 domain-containing protein n=1 Tax=Aliterella atlantica CENA595 TaxID=1618023 RepID=A0A0D8ZNQ9_9CYAN|nr:DUF1499 domain-containing protein [Aliterella atlantica]KJH69987.1 hypothetical protein UH38_20890 [Aliterella atlantica CENA595]
MAINKKTIFTFVFLLLAAVFLLGATLTISGDKVFAGTRPNNLGVNLSQLTPCPSTPNCVNSQSVDTEHSIAPLTYNSSSLEAWANLKGAIATFSRAKIIQEADNYIYAEFTLPVVGFVDDVEFQLDEQAKVINVRSASRLGESDLGVNRQRVENIRTKFAQLQAS